MCVCVGCSVWAFSSDGRAPASHAGGRGIDTPNVQFLHIYYQVQTKPYYYRTVQYTVYQTTTTFNISTRIYTAMGRPILCLEPLLQRDTASRPCTALPTHFSYTYYTCFMDYTHYTHQQLVLFFAAWCDVYLTHWQPFSRPYTTRLETTDTQTSLSSYVTLFYSV
jgi:hypothetical protein